MKAFFGGFLILILLTGCVKTTSYQEQKAEGSPEAAFALGNQLYSAGQGDEGVYWIKRAADSNHVPAQYALGLLLASGQFGDDRRQEAGDYLAKASESGMHQASYKLAEYFRTGVLGETDMEKAVQLYDLAIYQGSMDARKALGVMYLKGIGVAKDEAKANQLLSVFNN